jgi:hypothetical protein
MGFLSVYLLYEVSHLGIGLFLIAASVLDLIPALFVCREVLVILMPALCVSLGPRIGPHRGEVHIHRP